MPEVLNFTIYKSNSSNGRYVIHLSNTTSKYFWRKKEVEAFLNNYNFTANDLVIKCVQTIILSMYETK